MSGGDVFAVALIGAGRAAALHAAALQRPGVARVVAVVDPRADAAESLARRLRARPATDYRAVLAIPEVDAVDIAVPHDRHAEIAAAALAAGKHVFMDKPLATSLADGERLVDLVSRSDRTMMLCHNLLFHPAVVEAKRVVDSGMLGRPTVADAWSCGYLDTPPWDFRLSRPATGGGAWFDGAPHLLYTLEHLLGPISTVTALPGRGPSRIGGEDGVAAAARFESGAAATLRVSYADRLPGHDAPWPAGWRLGFELRGTGGALTLDVLPSPAVTRYDGIRAPATTTVECRFQDSFDGAVAEFVAAARGRRPPAVPVTASLRNLRQVLSATYPRGGAT